MKEVGALPKLHLLLYHLFIALAGLIAFSFWPAGDSPAVEEKDMRISNWRLAPTVGALALALAMIPSALAQCGLPSKLVKPSSWRPLGGGARAMGVALSHDEDDRDEPSIVGMWHVVFTATTSNPAGTIPPSGVIDNALAVWHADHTEIMNSVRPPQDGNFCLGVWEQTGRNKYYLNHIPWFANAYPTDPPTVIGPAVGPTHITETITLSADGCHFSGTFTLDAYNTSGMVVQSYTGTIAGVRVTTSTTVGELL